MNQITQTPLSWNKKEWYFLSVFYAREKWDDLITEVMQYYRRHTGQFCTYLFSFSKEKGEHLQVTFVSSVDDNHNYTNEIQTGFQTFVDRCPSRSTIQFPYGKVIWCNYPNNSLAWNRFRLPFYSDQYISFHQQTMGVALKLMENDFSEDSIFSAGLYLFTKGLCCIDSKEQKSTLSQILEDVSVDFQNDIEEIKALINKIDINEVHEAIESYRNENTSEYSTELVSWLNEAKILLKLGNYKTLCIFICKILGLTGAQQILILELMNSWYNKEKDENSK